MRNAWFFRSIAVAAVLALAGAVVLSRWANEQPLPLPADVEADPSSSGRETRVPRPTLLVGAGGEVLGGSVVDYAGAPVADVVVVAYRDAPVAEAAPQAMARSVATSEGVFELRGLEPGVYRLEVEGARVFSSVVRFVDVPGDPVRLTVARRVAVSGLVVEGGAPAPGVTVALSGVGTGVMTQQAGEAGLFEFSELVEGEYQVWAYGGNRAARAVSVARLGAGPFEPVSLIMDEATIVRGRVVDRDTGRGVASDVMLVDAAGVEPERFTATDEDGRFVIEGVPPGSWIPDARADGYISTELLAFEPRRVEMLIVPLTSGGVARGRVVDGAGVGIAGVAVSLRGEDLGGQPVLVSAASHSSRRARFRGEALLGGHARLIPRGELGVMLGPIPYPPPPGARIAVPTSDAAASPALPSIGELLTDGEGRYRIEGLRPGRYVAHLAHPGYAPGHSVEFSVQLGDRGREVETVLVPGLVVFGAVRDRQGAPIVGATVTAEAGEGAALAIAVTGADGLYRLQPIARDVTLRVSASRFGSATRAVRAGKLGRSVVEREEVFELVDADAAVRGRVVDPLGNALAGAVVGSAGRSVVSDERGYFAVEGVPPGVHALTVTHADYPPRAARLATDGEHEVKLEQGGGIRLDVRDMHTTNDLRAAALVAKGPSGQTRRAEVVKGAAVLAPIATGRWSLRVSADGYVPTSVSVEVPAGDGPRAVSVPSLRVDLQRGATVAGIVRDEHGERVAGAVVHVGEATATTDRDGNFRLTDVITGDVEIRATKAGAEGSTRLALRSGDEVVTLEVRLEAR